MAALHFAYRQRYAVTRVFDVFKSIFTSPAPLKRLAAFFVALAEMLGGVIGDGALTPLGEELDLTGYRLVFEDTFDGSSLDSGVWQYRGLGKSGENGYYSTTQARVEDGKLIITAEYLEDGPRGAGWYASDLQLRQKYKQGYFEISCKCSSGGDFWSAFWIQADHPYDHELSRGGVGGAEIDIMEATNYNAAFRSKKNSIISTVHCNGVDDDKENIDSLRLGFFKGKNIYEEYNRYGLKWTDSEYIFYINGVETARTSFGKGVSEVEEYVCVSMCIPQKVNLPKDARQEFAVDYLKIWQQGR